MWGFIDCQALGSAHPEVLGVHVQLLAVQLRQLGVGRLQVVQVLDGLPKGGEHLLAVGTDLGVANDGRGAGQVPEVVKEPLCPGVDDQQPGLGSAFLHVDLAPEAGNELLLLGCPVHHGGLWTRDVGTGQGNGFKEGFILLHSWGRKTWTRDHPLS
uniref:Uncharacterized protein n=1 Tax=Amazona collaria TaxID=241587 RepID=A0A8B9GB55_9PSIT